MVKHLICICVTWLNGYMTNTVLLVGSHLEWLSHNQTLLFIYFYFESFAGFQRNILTPKTACMRMYILQFSSDNDTALIIPPSLYPHWCCVCEGNGSQYVGTIKFDISQGTVPLNYL